MHLMDGPSNVGNRTATSIATATRRTKPQHEHQHYDGAEPCASNPGGSADEASYRVDKAGVIEGWHRKKCRDQQIEPDNDAPPKNLGFPTVVVAQFEESLGDSVEADQENSPDEDHDADMPAEVALDGGQGGHDGAN